MPALPFALYDSFSETVFGGSQAAVVSDAAGLDAETEQRIVGEMNLPAIGFVAASDAGGVTARFRSTVMELPMCGHGTVAMITRMVEEGVIGCGGARGVEIDLYLPSGRSSVSVRKREDGRPEILLEVRPPAFRPAVIEIERLAALLGIVREGFADDLPLEIAQGDFVHLVVPIRDLRTMRQVTPAFSGLAQFCRDHGIETVASFCSEVEHPESALHVRDFCPAVGVAESAAAGTTNAALTGYLIRHGILGADGDGRVVVRAEQGHEIGRPSVIQSIAEMDAGAIARFRVGGVATKLADGLLHV